jgi:ABC-2 type transport system permease protein
MLWYKAWLETRWRFLIGLALLVCAAAGVVFSYPKVIRLLAMVPNVDVGGELGRRIREGAELARTYRGYAWSQWFDQQLSNTWTLFAVLIGSGGLLTQSSGGAALFTLSLPVSRDRVLVTRAALGLGEMLILAVVPSLLIPALSPAVGERFSVGDALVFSACMFLAGAVFFSLAVLLSTVFADVWRPLLIAIAAAIALGLAEELFRDAWPFGIFRAMSGERYFRGGGLPLGGILLSVTASVAMLYAAAMNNRRRDF